MFGLKKTKGTPGTSVLFGGADVTDQEHHGFRLQAGLWFTQYRDLGVEASWFMLGSSSNGLSAISTGQPGVPDAPAGGPGQKPRAIHPPQPEAGRAASTPPATQPCSPNG